MTAYLVDENVLREIGPRGNVNVVKWLDQVEVADLRLSVITIFEKRSGWERRRRKDEALARLKLAEIDALAAAYGSRLLAIDVPIAGEWARLVGRKDKNRFDRALVATARVHDLVLVTRNIADMRGCEVRVLDPFRAPPKIELV